MTSRILREKCDNFILYQILVTLIITVALIGGYFYISLYISSYADGLGMRGREWRLDRQIVTYGKEQNVKIKT